MRILKWDDSLAIRIPKEVVEELQLKEGDDVLVLAARNRKAFEIARKPSVEELLEPLFALEKKVPKDFAFDRDEANAR